MSIRFKTLLVVSFIGLFLIPAFVSAKSLHSPGYGRGSGKEITINQPRGWPVNLKSDTYTNADIQSFMGMVVINAKPYNPWWRFFKKIPDMTTFSVSGFPANTDLHIYTHGYRNHEIKKTDASGVLTLPFSSKSGLEAIIKEQPSTWHVYVGGLINPKGGDCNKIGSWNETTKTCRLMAGSTVNQTISIDDSDITLDGNNATVTFSGGDGVYTNESNVTIKRLTVQNSQRGIVFHDSILTFASGGRVENVILQNNTTHITDEGVSGVNITGSTLGSGATGIYLFDQFDGFPTNNIVITKNNFKATTFDIDNNGTSFSLSNATDRGNFWTKNTGCTQDTANPSHCTQGYIIDSGDLDPLPWACENGWTKTCPVKPPSRTPTPTPTPTLTPTPTATPTGSVTPTPTPGSVSGKWASVIVIGTDTTSTIYKIPNTTEASQIVKIVPPGWILEITGVPQGLSTPVKDHADGSLGFIATANLDEDPSRQSEFSAKAVPALNSIEDRKKIITEAVEAYYEKSDKIDLYHQGGGSDPKNLNEFNKYILDLNFPKSLVLAMAVHESAKTLDNTICNRPYYSTKYAKTIRDGGIGIFQITSLGLRGLGSGMKNTVHSNDCNTLLGWPITESFSNYYSNTVQGIYANMKDGMRVIQEKYDRAKKLVSLSSPSKTWFFKDGISIDNSDIRLLLTVRAYNGFGKEETLCYKFLHPNGYLNALGTQLRTISTYFPDYTYSGKIDDLLIITDKPENRAVISICSPGLLQIEDNSRKITGYTPNGIKEEISNILYDLDTNKNADILFPQEDYTIRVIGTESGPYNLYEVRGANDGKLLEFRAQDIPLKIGEIHEYHIHIDPNTKKITSELRIDKNGDGSYEKTIKSGALLKISDNSKIIICHNEEKNNPHTIEIDENALQAHVEQGDHEGKCEDKDKRDGKDNKNVSDKGEKKSDEHKNEDKNKKNTEKKKR